MKIAARVIFGLGLVWVLGLILWNAYGTHGGTTGGAAEVAVVTSGTAQRHFFKVSSSEQGLKVIPLGLDKAPVPVQGLTGVAKLAKAGDSKPVETPLRALDGGVLEAPFDLKGVARAAITVEIQGFADAAEPKAGFTLVYEGEGAKSK